MKKSKKIFFLIAILSLFSSHIVYTANNLTPAGVTDLPEIDLASGNTMDATVIKHGLLSTSPIIRRIAAERLINYSKYDVIDPLIAAIEKEDDIPALNAMAKALVHPNINHLYPGAGSPDDLDALVKALQTNDKDTKKTVVIFISARITAFYLNTAQYTRIANALSKVMEIRDEELKQSAGHGAFVAGKFMKEHGIWTVEAVDILTFALRYAKDESDRRYALIYLNAIAKDYLEHTDTKDPDKMAIIYPKAIKALIYGLTDTCLFIRLDAKNYLKKYLYAETIIELTNRLKKQEFNERALPLAAELLYYGGEKLINTDHDTLAIESLTHALNYGNESIRNNAAYAFADFNNKEIFKENWDTFVTFMNIAANTVEDENLRIFCINRLGDANVTEAVPILLKNFNEKKLRRAAAISLGKLGTKEAIEFLITNAQPWLHRIETRALAVKGLGYVEKPDEKIKKILLKNMNSFWTSIKIASLRSAGMIFDTEIIPHLKERLHSFNRDIRHAALDALSNFDTPEAIKALGTAVKDKNGYVRSWSVRILAIYESDLAVEQILPALGDENYGILSDAIKALTESMENIHDAQLKTQVSERLEIARQRKAKLMKQLNITEYEPKEMPPDEIETQPLTISDFVASARQRASLAESL